MIRGRLPRRSGTLDMQGQLMLVAAVTVQRQHKLANLSVSSARTRVRLSKYTGKRIIKNNVKSLVGDLRRITNREFHQQVYDGTQEACKNDSA